MEQAQSQLEDLLSVGARYAFDTHALCQDVAHQIFPTAIVPPTEAAVSAVTAKIVGLVADIERYLAAGKSSPLQPISWPLLAKSGLLREPDLIDFIFARTVEDRLENLIEAFNPSLATRLLDHPDKDVVHTVQTLFAADSLQRQARGHAYMALPAELLHKTCWRIVAALEVETGMRSMANISAGRALLDSYDEAQTIKGSARKIVHFIGESKQDLLLQPEIAGLHLHVATISAALDLEHDHVLSLIGANSSAPYAIVLSALGVAKEQAIRSIMLMRGSALSPKEADSLSRGYGDLDQDRLQREIDRWAMTRARYLAFGAL